MCFKIRSCVICSWQYSLILNSFVGINVHPKAIAINAKLIDSIILPYFICIYHLHPSFLISQGSIGRQLSILSMDGHSCDAFIFLYSGNKVIICEAWLLYSITSLFCKSGLSNSDIFGRKQYIQWFFNFALSVHKLHRFVRKCLYPVSRV